MEGESFNILAFGDESPQAYQYLLGVQRQRGRNVAIDLLFDQTFTVLQQELRRQSPLTKEQESLLKYRSIPDLAEGLQQRDIRNSALEDALLSIAQITGCMSYFQAQALDYLSFNDTCIIGHGLGLITAAVVASCRTLTDLSLVAPDLVRIVFRMGLLSTSTSQQLQLSEDGAPWSITLYGVAELEVKNALVEYYQGRSIPPLSRAFLSAVFEDAVTISGPPCIIKHLLEESDYFKSRPNSPCKTYGLYHAPHLYGPSDVDDILRGITFPTIDRSSRSLLSSVGGYTVTAMNVRSALEQAILEILTLPTNWTSVVDGVLHQVTASGRKQCQIMTFSHSRPSEAVIKSLKDRLGLSVELQNLALFEGGRSEGGTDKIAIIGVAGRFPGATDLDGLWRILEQGRDLHQVIPSSRFDPNTHVDPTGKRKNTSYTPYGCFIEEPGLFDNRFFNMSPRESVQTDPMHRLALVTAYEALEMAGFVPNNTPSTMLERIGTFYGQTSDDWREVNGAQSIGTYFIPGGVRAFAPGRINYFFKFGGPSYSIDTACSSGLAAIQVACSSLLRRECDMALSGGLNILTNPDIYAGLSRGQFLSKTGGCRVFDAEADGYCRADAIGSVVLKRLEDAEADNDKILGVILGSATNHSAQAISITHPHAESQASLYRNILNSAGTDALDVGYVETHGTGTQAGDSVEMQSVTDVFAPESRHRRTPLYLGSIKANVGHSEAAAGVTALFKLLLMLQRDMIPRHIGVKTALNPNFPANLTSRNVHVPAMAVPWSSDVKKLAFLNSFSAAGGNTALLLEEYRSKARSQKADPRSTHVICLSAKSPASLKRAVEKMVDYLHRQKWTSLSNLAYSLSARRMHYSYRLAAVVSRVDEIESRLLSALAEPLIPVTPSRPKLVYVFTGQGAFYTSLGKALFQTSLVFRNTLLRLNSIAEKQSSVCFLPAIEGQTSEENSPVVSQVAQVCVQIALAELWSDWNVKPDAVIGHSLGEYAALNTAGVLSASDTIYLVAERAKLLQDRCTAGTHGMLAARLSPSMLERVQEEIPCEIACLNGREDIILSGSMDDVGKTSDILSTSGIRSIQLNLEYAFHSAQVDPVLDAFEDLANGVNFHTPRVPILSPLLGTDIREAGVVSAAYLRRHMREQVNFVGALTHARNHNIVESGTTFLEIGPHPICSKMVCSILEHVNVVSSMRKDEDSWLTLSKSLASLYLLGYDIQWNKVHRDFESAHELLHLPSYSFDERNFWTDYQGDWCLTKGESHPALPPAAPPNEDLPLWQRKSNLSTSSVHCIVEETVKNGQAKVVIQTDLSEGCLNGLIRGHMVSGKAVFPSSMYADMALTVADYLYKMIKSSSQGIGMDVCQMKVMKPLIVNSDLGISQILQLSAVSAVDLCSAVLSFSGVDSNGKEFVQYAECIVEYKDPASWLSVWGSIDFLVFERVLSLKKAGSEGLIPKITRGLAYKLLAVTVDYDAKFRGMDIILLDGQKFEATAEISFQASEGNFCYNPVWIDSLCQLSGFVLYASDAIDSRRFSFINHGWKYMRFARPLVDKRYRSYVRMFAGPGNTYEGNVYVLDEQDMIVGVFGGVVFQKVHRTVLDEVLSSQSPSARRKSRSGLQPISLPEQNNQQVRPQPVVAEELPGTHQTVLKNNDLGSSALSLSVVQKTSSLMARIERIIVENADLDIADLQGDVSFRDLGIDSLLSLSIVAQLREDLDLDIPGSLFLDYPTVKSLRLYLVRFDEAEEDESERSISTISSRNPHSSPMTSLSSDEPFNTASYPPAKSVLLQGNRSTATKTLFLFPDGSGSAASYASIPLISSDLIVYSLDCPFRTTPEDWDVGCPGVATLYLAEIRRRQPFGPYMLGGWSAGGIIAYEAMQQLLAAGEAVEHLILLDVPCPLNIQAFPPGAYKFFHDIGVLGHPNYNNKDTTLAWLIPHFEACIKNLVAYNPLPILNPVKIPKIFAIWARYGVCGAPGSPKPDFPTDHPPHLVWLLENRTDFGPNEWLKLMPDPHRFRTEVVDANHFTLMRDPVVKQLGALIRRGIEW